MDVEELIEKKVEAYRKKWAELTVELRAELERLKWLAESAGIELPELPKLPDDAEKAGEAAKAGSITLKPGMFFSMSQTDAAAAFLKMMRRPCTLEEIRDALERGGLVFSGKDPKGTLYTQLVRATLRFVKLPTGEFALLDWYEKEKAKRMKPREKGSNASKPQAANEDEDEDEDDAKASAKEDDDAAVE